MTTLPAIIRLGRAGALTLAGVTIAAAILVGGCTTTQGPLYGPNSPRNGAGQPVDPVYGTPIPGYPAPNGAGGG